MCLEGGCGTCIVNVCGVHPVTKETRSWSVNSCLFPIFSCHGMSIKTVEALGNRKDGYHPIQERLAHMNGSQCGFCSPGMVMTMYSLMEAKKGTISIQDVENSLGGNICRCTGYRPILDAFKSLASEASEIELPDIEELQICPKTNVVCSAQCPAVSCEVELHRPVHLVFRDDKEWHKVYTLFEIFTLLALIGSKPYILLGGNTAHGVYRRSTSLQIFIDINSVEELRNHYFSFNQLVIGASTTLYELMEILSKAAKTRPGFGYCQQIVNHLELVASPSIRNVGTIAGNLSIKNQHPEFVSDVYILLEAAGVKLTIVESLIISYDKTPSEYVRMDMTKKLLKSITFPSIDQETNIFRSYKVAERAENAISYVNAAFLLKLNTSNTIVSKATLCFGGINPKFTHAARTEQLIIGKKLFNNATIQQALSSLAAELEPDSVLPNASAEYRKGLAVSLFYKFILNVAMDKKIAINPRFQSGSTMLERPVSSGQQHYDTIEKNWPVTQYVPKLEGLAQASGEAKYTNDFPPFPDELYAAFVVATRPNAAIGKIDASEALRLPGAVAFYSARDIPGTNNFVAHGMTIAFPDAEEIFCSGRVLFHGQPVGVLVAKQFDQAVYAAKHVKIIYERFSEEPVYPTLKSVLHNWPRQRIVNPPISTTDAVAGSAETAETLIDETTQRIQGTLEIYGQYQFPLETQSCICVPSEDGMDIFAATQWINLCQVAIASALKIPENSLNFNVRRVGGSYGAKLTRASQIACACALAAHLTKRPVRFVMTMEANMESIGKRFGCISNYEVDVNAKGKILKLSTEFLHDYGSSLNDDVIRYTNEAFAISYMSSTWKYEGKAIITDSPSNTWARAPGSTQGIATIETIMEHIAWITGVDPMQVRLINMSPECKLQQLLPQFRQEVEYDKRKQLVDEFNANNRWRKRGIAMVPMQYPFEYIGAFHVLVSIFAKDGTVAITHGGIEIGQGINTKAAQVAAFILGIPLAKIAIKPTTIVTSPNAGPTGGSMTSEAVCYGVIQACEILNARIQPIKNEFKNAPWEKITQICYTRDIDLSALFHYKNEDLKAYSILGVSCAEVEVDILTGNIQLKRVDILEDTGESLSPGIDVGQIEGAFVTGIGYWLTESLVYDMASGALLTNRTWNYKPPGAKDIPVDFRIRLLQNGGNPFGVLRSKATGEPALTMSVVVVFALRYALRSSQKDAGRLDVWIPLGSASTPQQIFLKAFNTAEQYLLN
ncbi:uncharacterized protein LOC128725312 [Anopheles nili]|uniref:uncharacterized protein LOC128725312 n=1 Tax=Anopheles nili TaxID=185578 RepID=UPI00237B2BAF|nr:uncharacterized protein LOC128725312 [Anopheles nili]